jgi:hypothetical protein
MNTYELESSHFPAGVLVLRCRLAIVRRLHTAGMPPARGGEWTSVSAGNVIRRKV